jgi:nucleoside-diphosphate-sugar epimerase
VLQKEQWQIDAVRRRPPAGSDGFHWHAADYTRPGSLDFAAALQPAFVVATFTPAQRDPKGYCLGFSAAAEHLRRGLGTHQPRLVLMVSSTRVYAEADGGWVDESSPLATSEPQARAIIDAERQLLGAGFAAVVLRCGGIYGKPHSRLLERIAHGDIAPAKPLRYTNRIHRDDCVGFIRHLLCRAGAGDRLQPVYNGVDDHPAPAHEVEQWLAQQMGIEIKAAPGSPPVAAVHHKRCRNQRLHATGYALRFPDYRAGYRALLARRERR